MKVMGKVESVLVLMTTVISVTLFTMCGMKEMGSPESGENVPELPVHIDSLYVTGVEYPAGYDWVKDTEYGTVSCTLFLEKEGERIVELPVGYSYEIASDPDMHRCIGGHLYTDFSSDTETVIKKDGATLFRYPGREMVSDFLVSGSGEIYIIGQSRSGDDGFVFRKDGSSLITVENGRALSSIQETAGHIYLVYKMDETSRNGQGGKPGYYLYDNGDIFKFAEVSSEEEIISAEVTSDGEISYTAVEIDKGSGLVKSGYFCAGGREKTVLDTESYGTLEYCKVLQAEPDAILSGICSDRTTGEHTSVVWNGQGRVLYSLPEGKLPYFSFVRDGDVYDFIRPESSFDDMTCYRNGSLLHSYGRDMNSYGDRPASICRDNLYFAFSDRSSARRAYMAVDDKVNGYTFNGFFTGVSAW